MAKKKTEYELNLERMAGAYTADRSTPEDKARAAAQSNAMSYEALKKILESEKPGTEKYNTALASMKKVQADMDAANAAAQAARTAETTKKSASDRAKLVDALTRAKDYGTPQDVTDAQDALDKFDGKQKPPAVSKDKSAQPPAGTKVSGTNLVDNSGKVVGTVGKDSKGNPVYTVTDKNAVVSDKGTSSASSSKGTATTTPPPATGDKTIDPKGIWISALTQTFKTGIDDPKQKAQIDNLFAEAKAQKWTEATFMDALKSTSWWQTTLPTFRQFYIDSHDPRNAATFAQTMLNKVDSVQAAMENLGIKVNDIDPVTGKVIDNSAIVKGIASQALQNGWDDNQIRQHLANKSEVIFTGGGQLGGYMDQIKRQALNYGVSLDNNQITTINHDLLNPQDGKDAQWYLNNIKQQAIDANPAFAPALKEGRTLYDVTSSYRNQMATLLEVDPTDITWNDLMAKVMNKDKGTANTFADFTKQVKSDPLWQTTKNAKETYSNTALDLMKQFGFMG